MGKKILRGFLVAVMVLVVFSSFVCADVIHLKNGGKLEGKIIKQDESSVTLKMSYGEVTVKKNKIASITYGEVKTPVIKTSVVEPSKLTRPPHYLIITRDMFKNTLNDFATWKRSSSGLDTTILTAEKIKQDYKGDSLTEKIKDAIVHYYQNKNTKYVLLVGDTKINPNTRSNRNHATPKEAKKNALDSCSLEKKWNIPTGFQIYGLEKNRKHAVGATDIFYADIDYVDLNKNGFCEYNEMNINEGPIVYVGRWPVRTKQELLRIINKTKKLKPIEEMLIIAASSKTISEVKRLPESRWYNNCIPYYMFSVLPKDLPITFMENTTKLTEKKIKARLDEIPSHFNFIQYNNNTDTQEIKDAMINAKGVIYVLAHGGHNTISPRGRISADDLHFKNIIPLFETQSCYVFTYYNSDIDSFNEALIKKSKGPVIVVNPHDSKIFYSSLFESKSVGESFYKSLKQHEYPVLLGDPSLVLCPKSSRR